MEHNLYDNDTDDYKNPCSTLMSGLLYYLMTLPLLIKFLFFSINNCKHSIVTLSSDIFLRVRTVTAK